MQVIIKGEPLELRVQTITLQPETGGALYGFHCLSCGHQLQKIGGKVSKVYPIYEPSDQVPVITRCRQCRREYNFQTHDGYSTEKVKVVLHPLESRNYFYCYREKAYMMEYGKDYIRSQIDNEYKTTPFESSCINPVCDIVYSFEDLV